MWDLADYKIPKKADSREYLSEATQMEYDCANETSRLIAVNIYTENMQYGSVVATFTYKLGETSINPITPNSTGETALKLACGKK